MHRSHTWLPSSATPRQLTIVTAVTLALGQLVLRAWATLGSYFYFDDLSYVSHASSGPIDQEFLTHPYGGHLMPAGWLVERLLVSGDPYNWMAHACVNIGFAAAADITTFLMLVVLFGMRPAILAPYALYLYSAVSFPGYMWWAASLNLMPLLVTAPLAIACYVTHLRRGSLLALLGTVVSLLVSFAFYEKTLLVLPVLIGIAYLYFDDGGWFRRIFSTLRKRWLSFAVFVAMAAAYVPMYLHWVPQATSDVPDNAAGIVTTEIGSTYVTAMVGGPWTWDMPAPPNSQAAPPIIGVVLAWFAVAAVIGTAIATRKRAGRALVLLVGYLLTVAVLVLVERAGAYGEGIAKEYRYLTDTALISALVLGLLYLPMRGATETVETRDEPLVRLSGETEETLRARATTIAFVGTVVMVVGGLISTIQHALAWQDNNPTPIYMANLHRGLHQMSGRIPLANSPVDPSIMWELNYPANLPANLFRPYARRFAFPQVTDKLYTLAPDGRITPALIAPASTNAPGPDGECGWFVNHQGRALWLTRGLPQWTYWVRVGYLVDQDTPVTFTIGDDHVTTHLAKGVGQVYFRHEGRVPSFKIDGLEKKAKMCTTEVAVGSPVAP